MKAIRTYLVSLSFFGFGLYLVGCGAGLYISNRLTFRGFPQDAGYITSTRYIHGSLQSAGLSSVPTVRVSIDGASATEAEIDSSGSVLKWRAALPSRFSNPSRWNIGSVHSAEVSVYGVASTLLSSKTANFRMGSLQDGNGDGYPDLAVGASMADASTVDDGSAFYFPSNRGAFSANAYTRVNDPSEVGQRFALRTHFVGDLNGDGYAEVGISAYQSDTLGTNRGGVYIAYGSASGPGFSSLSRINCSGCTNGTFFGAGLTTGGDLNNDGYDDLVVGTIAGTQSISVFLGNSSGISGLPNQTVNYPAGDATAYFGFSLRILPDVTGDGYPDLLVSALLSDTAGPADAGTAYVFTGTSTGISTTPAVTLFEPTPTANNGFGRVGWLGDVSGDGIDDFFATSIWSGGSGTARIFFGPGSSSLPSSPSASLTHPTLLTNALFGHDGAPIGDINGDGIFDFAFGSPGNNTGTLYKGEVHLYLGQTSGSNFTRHSTIEYPGTDGDSRFGRQVCPIDWDSDGLLDLLVSADYADASIVDAGSVTLIPRTTTGFDTSASSTIAYPGSDSGSIFGNTVCGSN
jgi:hypothetical protein